MSPAGADCDTATQGHRGRPPSSTPGRCRRWSRRLDNPNIRICRIDSDAGWLAPDGAGEAVAEDLGWVWQGLGLWATSCEVQAAAAGSEVVVQGDPASVSSRLAGGRRLTARSACPLRRCSAVRRPRPRPRDPRSTRPHRLRPVHEGGHSTPARLAGINAKARVHRPRAHDRLPEAGRSTARAADTTT